MTEEVLRGLKVVELAQGVAGPYVGKLFADFGAEVIKIEPPGSGDECRHLPPLADKVPSPEASGFFAYLNANKLSVSLDLWSEEGNHQARDLCNSADIVIESSPPGTLNDLNLGYTDLHAANPDIILTSVSWFGQDGPYSQYKGADPIIHGLTGLAFNIGPVEGPPTLPGGYQAQFVGGIAAFIATMGALLGLKNNFHSQHVDTSIFEANICFTETGVAAFANIGISGPRHTRLGINRYAPTFPMGIYPCKEGWIGITTLTPAQWFSLCDLIGMPELKKNPDYLTTAGRMGKADELDEIFFSCFLDRSAEDWFHLAQDQRIPFAMVPDMAGLLSLAHFRNRGAYSSIRHPNLGIFEAPAVPFKLMKTPALNGGTAPTLGQHNKDIFRDDPFLISDSESGLSIHTGTEIPVDTGRKPFILSGIRVIDMSMGWSGPLAARHLGDMGAEVIKVEAIQHPDWWRGWDMTKEWFEEKLYEKASSFNTVNRNKLGITLDLTTPEGSDLLKRLVKLSDVVIENNAASVLPKLRLDYPNLKKINSRLIMASLPAFGVTGDWKNYRAYGSTVEQASGLPHLTGKPDWPPTMLHVALGDAVAGLNAVAAVLLALFHKQKTGEGQQIDISQVECLFPLASQGLIQQSMTGQAPERYGNRHPIYAPHGVFPCAGEEEWVTILVTHQDEWQALCRSMGRDDLARDRFLSESSQRKEREAELETIISEWTGKYDPGTLMNDLQAVGVPAGIVRPARELLEDPQLLERDFFEWMEKEHMGIQLNAKAPYRIPNGYRGIQTPTPCLGEHNETVLCGLLGLSKEELQQLEAKGIIGTIPAIPESLKLDI